MENKIFYIKYLDNQSVEIETHFDGELERRTPIDSVSKLIAAYKTATTPLLDNIPVDELTLHYMVNGPAIPRNTLLTSIQNHIGSYGHPFIIKSKSGIDARTTSLINATAIASDPMQLDLFLPCQIPFYNNICNAVEQDTWLLFEQEIFSSTLKRLFIRDSYKSIASNIKPGINKTIITGTPGIGKSLFLIYLLWKLIKQGKRVLFIYHPDKIYYDGQGGVFELTSLPSVVDHAFWASDLWCLFDAKGKNSANLNALPYERCSFVVSTSPKRELTNDFKKSLPLQIFYMPIWTKPELEAIAPDFAIDIDWRHRFKVLGGIPRRVLEDTSSDPVELLQNVCRQCKLDDCIKEISFNSTITENSKASHSLIHMTSVDPFTESSVAFASRTALDIIIEIKGMDVMRKMTSLLVLCEENPLAAALCGHIFEPYAVEMLEKGGVFDSHQLVHGNKKTKPEETLLFIPLSKKQVAGKVLPNQVPNQLYVPKTKNYAAIDAWIPGIGAFQATVSNKHDIKKSTEEDLKMLGDGAEKLYWLLPPLHYHSFTKKSPTSIDQYAVKIPYPSM
ncbi:hypothetical protein BATDEDRAFT_25352 [Batrachochytrium dendrobatidis JAM81]|uniref:Crinkler effector protein N-terminal domain-containing protein n=1 Tax=Batrachochytrium dendrobatidis (strain JAM81 / FGSC 10211) TaxID=684364 RepID=F4P4R1_BATDJ|nr:uncharacterized protein BATDEDRAFT_25352 [Batrachochytrium dendrobatidis JAM81]EGF79879.1 hypothetical protein BATDEDRAFT_25352 [Batrachochytrium dendrobatidis JAM81]|eukprot:XP_006679430.1 hypothetical protein BATDEDRAFT_25352 [Batrachochytrium dendrobatidis JAM81]